MSRVVTLRCRCGQVEGVVDLDGSQGGICYCDDCRAFAHELGRGDLLDDAGGTAIVQVRPSGTRLTRGREHVGCLRLSDQGMLRFFATCCQTPIGNVMHHPRLPFIGIVRPALHGDDDAFPAFMRIQGRFATKTPPPGTAQTVTPSQALHTLWFLARSALASRGKPHPFFDDAGAPIATPRILTSAERDALRARDRTG